MLNAQELYLSDKKDLGEFNFETEAFLFPDPVQAGFPRSLHGRPENIIPKIVKYKELKKEVTFSWPLPGGS